MSKLSCIIALSFLLLIPEFAPAQKQSGAIEGTVTDNSGYPIPGVIITVSSPSLIGGTAVSASDQNGFYRFPAIAAGEYQVKAELAGFQTVIRKEAIVSVGFTLTVNFLLEIRGATEIVEVLDAPPLIDVSTTAVSFTLRPEVISNLPRLQNIQSLLALTPGVGDDLIAYGADGPKANSLLVDGVNVSSPRSGNLVAQYNYNWLEEVQVTGIGAPAEYGGFTGVLGNFTIRSGGDQYHGLFETFFQNENLISTNRPNPAGEIPIKRFDINAQIGGPILRDKLWFFSGFQYPYNESHPFGYDGVVKDIYTKFITKTTYKVDEDNTLQGFGHWNNNYLEGQGGNAFVLPEATITTRDSQSSWNATWISLLNADSSFEGRFGGLYDDYKDLEDDPDLPGRVDTGTGIFSVNSGGRINIKRTRYQLNTTFSHHARDFIRSNHDFRFGLEFERSHAFTEFHYNGNRFYGDFFGEPYYRYLLSGYIFDGSNHRVSTFAQDDWNVTDRVNVSLGVRWDHNRGRTDRGTVFSTDPVAPRIGIVWLLDPKNQTVIKAHFGDFYQALLERDYFFLTDNGATNIYELYNPINGEWEEDFRFHEDYFSDKKLKQPYVRQFSLGLDRVLPHGIPFGVHYIHRQFGNILEDVGEAPYEPVSVVNPLTGENLTVYRRLGDTLRLVLTNPGELYRKYDGLELYAAKHFSTNLSVSGSFVYSRLRGNSPGDVGWGGANTPFLDSPNTLINFPGKLANDPTIAWKIFGSYSLPWGFITGWYFRHASGDTWTPRAVARPYNILFFGEVAGSRRLPSQNLLDMRVEKEVPFYRGQLRFTVDLFNVFNGSYPVAIEDRHFTSGFGLPRAYNEPRRIRLGLRYTF